MKSSAFLLLSVLYILFFCKSRCSVVPSHQPSKPSRTRSRRSTRASAPVLLERNEQLNTTFGNSTTIERTFASNRSSINTIASGTPTTNTTINNAFKTNSSVHIPSVNTTVKKNSADRTSVKQLFENKTNASGASEENKLFKDTPVNSSNPQNATRIQTLLQKAGDAVKQKAKNLFASLRKQALGLLSYQETLVIPEETIESHYLRFVEKAIDGLNWHEKLFRYIAGSLDVAISNLADSTIEEETEAFVSEGKIPKHKLGSKNHTIRTEVAGSSSAAPTDGDATFREMPSNAEDLIRGFRAPENGGKEVVANEQEEAGGNEEEYSEEEEEEEETDHAEPDSQVETHYGTAGGVHSSQDTSHEGQQRTVHGRGAAQGSLSSGFKQNDGNGEGGVFGKQPPVSPEGIAQGGDTISSNPHSENAATMGTEESQEEFEEGSGSDSDNNMETGNKADGNQGGSASNPAKQGNSDSQDSGAAIDSTSSGRNAEQSSAKYSGSKHGVVNGHNTTQLSLMVYKIAKTEKIFSMAAAPCREVSVWMPEVVMRLELELPGFQFYCIDMDETGASMKDLKEAFGDVSGGYIQSSPEEIEQGIPSNLDLVVSWMGMQNWGIRKSWRFIKGLRRSGARMALFSNNPTSGNGNSASKTINIRKSPLLFNEPQRVIGKVSSDDATQLLLYSMDGLREGF